MLNRARLLAWMILSLVVATARAEEARQLVQRAVQTELAASAADHSCWLYFDVDRKPDSNVEQWVAETRSGALHRVLVDNGLKLTRADQQNAMTSFISSPAAQAKQHKAGQHDDQQATQMLSILPHAFLWTIRGTQGGTTILHFKPDPNFRPPTWESRVFAAMEGDMKVNNAEHRIVSLQGRLIHDVRFFGGLLGDLRAGGTFDVERRQTGNGDWQITETHVHIEGHALLFKNISEDEDEVKSRFKPLPADISLWNAEHELLEQSD
jgi:hypothetical protein